MYSMLRHTHSVRLQNVARWLKVQLTTLYILHHDNPRIIPSLPIMVLVHRNWQVPRGMYLLRVLSTYTINILTPYNTPGRIDSSSALRQYTGIDRVE